MRISRAILIAATLASMGLVGCSSSSSGDAKVYSRARMEEYDRTMAASDQQPPVEAGAIAPLPGSANAQSAVDRQGNVLVTPPLPGPGAIMPDAGVDVGAVSRAAAGFVGATLAPTGSDQITDHFVTADRDRVEGLAKDASVRAEIAQFVQNWHGRYDESFATARMTSSLATAFKIVSPDSADAQVAGGRLAPDANDEPNANSGPTTRPSDGEIQARIDESNRKAWVRPAGNNEAVILVPVTAQTLNPLTPRNTDASSQKVDDVKINVRREDGTWKIALPESVDGRLVATRLADRIHELNARVGQWPSDPNEAYRMFAGQVLSCAAEK